ncbi:hypothetical protein JF541_07290 [Marinobacter hydrocarbonoclasticus]|uniref:hypothetical protein n=1 Tax=Marinobacter nauticus TaxID=2743 RepID=UPI001A8DEF06|nr:hypothetical protein [Marinobacter nauticus]MBN8238942.1 hypothetical protein [Marinobacter nauticus]
MSMTNILKETAKKTPVPTIVAVIVFLTFSKVIESDVSEGLLALISVLTFVVILVMMVLWRGANRGGDSEGGKPVGESAINDVEISDGDVFIGGKGNSRLANKSSVNKITGVKSKKGDVFIGEKSTKR